MKVNEILEKELEVISVPDAEVLKLKKLANDFISSLKERGLSAQVGGSLAKGTMTKKEKQDIDIFVVFDFSEDILGLEKVLNSIKLLGKLKKVHGSRDYFQVICEDAILEIIPVVKNSDPERAENVTDVSLSHVKYVGKELKKNPKTSDEIKLAKAFCLANNCYGAESYIRGFSGYSLEVLIIHFGSFVNFLKGIPNVKVIDSMKYFKSEREVLREINSSKLGSPIIVVDPTYKYRNVTAGLGLETYSKFIEISKEFLKSPSLEFFNKKEIDVQEIREFAKLKKATFVEIELETNRQEGDIAGTKCKKFLDFFESELIRKQQNVLRKDFVYRGGQKARGYLVVKENFEIEVKGPSKGLSEAVKKFKEFKGSNVFLKGNFYYTKEKSGVKEVFELVSKVGKEMGAWGRLV